MCGSGVWRCVCVGGGVWRCVCWWCVEVCVCWWCVEVCVPWCELEENHMCSELRVHIPVHVLRFVEPPSQ